MMNSRYLWPVTGLFLAWVVIWNLMPVATAARIAPLEDQPIPSFLLPESCVPGEILQDGGFEAGLPNPAWQTSSNVFSDILDNTTDPSPRSGLWKAWLGGDNLVQEKLWQVLSITGVVTRLRVSYWWRVSTFETSHPFDTLEVQIRDAAGNSLETLETLTDGDASTLWQQSVFTLTQAYAGQTLQLAFVAQTDANRPTSFFLDEVSVLQTCAEAATPTPTLPTATLTPTTTATLPAATLTPTTTATPTRTPTLPTPTATPMATATPEHRVYLPLVRK